MLDSTHPSQDSGLLSFCIISYCFLLISVRHSCSGTIIGDYSLVFSSLVINITRIALLVLHLLQFSRRLSGEFTAHADAFAVFVEEEGEWDTNQGQEGG